MVTNRRILQLLTLVIFFIAVLVHDGAAQRRRTAALLVAWDSLGVGTGAPGAMLHIQPDSSSSHRRLFFVEDTTGQAANDVDTAFVIMAGGKTGIGTATPNAKLQVAGVVNIDGFDTGNFIADEYDLRVGTNDTAAVMRIGNLEFGTSDDRTVGTSLTAGGAVFFGVQNTPDGIGEFIFTTAGGDIRLAIPRSGAGYATNNARSGTYAGPSVMKDSIMIGSYWGFNRLAMDTNNKGADLGVQNNIQIGDSAYVNTAILIGGKQFTTQGDSTLIKSDLIYTSGSVGIGTAVPSSPLTVGGSSASFVVTREIIPAGTDSMFSVTFPSGFPVIAFGAAGDDWLITTNASDQALFENAEGGYIFDEKVGIGTASPITNLDVDGGLALSLVTKTTTYIATINDHTIICDGTSGIFTVTLPTAASSFNSSDGTGLILEIKKIDSSANAITVDGNGAETIDGSATAVIQTQYNSITIQSNGTEWWIL